MLDIYKEVKKLEFPYLIIASSWYESYDVSSLDDYLSWIKKIKAKYENLTKDDINLNNMCDVN